jgi:hypothetical protein
LARKRGRSDTRAFISMFLGMFAAVVCQCRATEPVPCSRPRACAKAWDERAAEAARRRARAFDRLEVLVLVCSHVAWPPGDHGHTVRK